MNVSAPGNADRHPLAARLAAGPYVAAPDNAERQLDDWLSEIEPAQSAAIEMLLGHANARDILLGIAEFSPYLFDLARADATRLTRLLSCDPDSHLASLIDGTAQAVLAASGESDVAHLLRSALQNHDQGRRW